MREGHVCDPGDLVSAYAQAISTELDPQIAELGDMVDNCETGLQDANIYDLRRRIAESRSGAIAFRRFIAPNRDALITLAALDVGWLQDEDRVHIREAADRFARMAEELEAIRERTALLHEQLSDYRTEQIDQRSLRIAVVAFIFLPLTFITGLLGMNVQGIPFAHQPWSFLGGGGVLPVERPGGVRLVLAQALAAAVRFRPERIRAARCQGCAPSPPRRQARPGR